MVKSTYGHDIKSNEDAYNKLAIEAFSAVFSLGLNGLTSVDLVPICKCPYHIVGDAYIQILLIVVRHFPSWFPGMGLLERAKQARILIDKMVEEPYQQVKSQRVRSSISSVLFLLRNSI